MKTTISVQQIDQALNKKDGEDVIRQMYNLLKELCKQQNILADDYNKRKNIPQSSRPDELKDIKERLNKIERVISSALK